MKIAAITAFRNLRAILSDFTGTSLLSEVAGKYNNPYSLTSGIFLNDPRESNSRCNDVNKAGR